MSDTVLLRSIADALQEGHAISQRVSAKALHDAADEIERLQDGSGPPLSNDSLAQDYPMADAYVNLRLALSRA